MYISKPDIFVVPVWGVEGKSMGIEALNTREDILIGLSLPTASIPRSRIVAMSFCEPRSW